MRETQTRVIAVAALAMTTLSGCSETGELTLYLQDLQVRGPVSRLPVHITKNPAEHQITISPSFWGATRTPSEGTIDGHSLVNQNGLFQVDTIRRSDHGVYFQDPGNVNSVQFGGKNLRWLYPASGGGLDIDLSISTNWALSLGANYSVAEGKGLWGYRAGLGIRQHKGSVGLRFDAGWEWQSLAYDAMTVASDRALSGTVSKVAFFRDVGISWTGNFYAALTVNGANPEWTVNPFLQVGISNQTLEDYKPTAPQEVRFIPPFFLVPPSQLFVVQDLRGKFASTRIHLTPGIFMEVDPTLRLLVGTRFSIESGIESLSDPVLIWPFVQVEWSP